MKTSLDTAFLSVVQVVPDDCPAPLGDLKPIGTGVLISTPAENPENENLAFMVCTKSVIEATQGTFNLSYHVEKSAQKDELGDKNWILEPYFIHRQHAGSYLEHSDKQFDLACLEVSPQFYCDCLYGRKLLWAPIPLSSLRNDSPTVVKAGDEVWVLGYSAHDVSRHTFPILQRTRVGTNIQSTSEDFPYFCLDTPLVDGLDGSAVFIQRGDGSFNLVGIVSGNSRLPNPASNKENVTSPYTREFATVVKTKFFVDMVCRAGHYCEARREFYDATNKFRSIGQYIGSPVCVDIEFPILILMTLHNESYETT